MSRGFPKWVVPPNHPFNRMFHYKPSTSGSLGSAGLKNNKGGSLPATIGVKHQELELYIIAKQIIDIYGIFMDDFPIKT